MCNLDNVKRDLNPKRAFEGKLSEQGERSSSQRLFPIAVKSCRKKGKKCSKIEVLCRLKSFFIISVLKFQRFYRRILISAQNILQSCMNCYQNLEFCTKFAFFSAYTIYNISVASIIARPIYRYVRK